MLRKLLLITMFFYGLGYAFEASAIPRIKAQEEDAAEADKIVVTFNSDKRTGKATVEGCRLCPMQLDIDENTSFLVNHKMISRKKAESFSGKPGTIFFKKEQTTRIHW